MKPVEWFPPYLPIRKRSIPSRTYSRQSWEFAPEMRLHSIIACGLCSPKRRNIPITKIGISVRPSGTGTSGRERDSVPGSTAIFPFQLTSLVLSAWRMPSRNCSVSLISSSSGYTFDDIRASAQPFSTITRIATATSRASSMNGCPAAAGMSTGNFTRGFRQHFLRQQYRHLPVPIHPSSADEPQV